MKEREIFQSQLADNAAGNAYGLKNARQKIGSYHTLIYTSFITNIEHSTLINKILEILH